MCFEDFCKAKRRKRKGEKEKDGLFVVAITLSDVYYPIGTCNCSPSFPSSRLTGKILQEGGKTGRMVLI
jgi:hypothetical protein